MKAKRSLTAFILALLLAVGMTAWQAPASAAAEEQNELQVLRVKDWILDVMTEDYYKFEVVFDGDVLPFGDGEEFRMIDGNEQQKAYMDYFKLCGKTLSQINEEVTDTEGWEFVCFPSSLGGLYQKPILVNVHELNQMQVWVHKEYVATLTGDITFEVVEGSVITSKSGNEYVAPAGLLWTLTENVRATTAGEWYIDKPVVPADRDADLGVSGSTPFIRDTSMPEYYVMTIVFSRDVFRNEAMHTLDYSIQDGTHGDFSYLRKYFTVNGKTVEDITINTDDSAYNYVTFKDHAPALRCPVMMISVYQNQMIIGIHEQYVADNGLMDNLQIGVTEDFYMIVRAPNLEETAYERVGYKVAEGITFTMQKDRSFTCSAKREPYVPDNEIIERKYTLEDMDKFEYDTINLHSISPIVSIGDVVFYNGERRTLAQYIVMYFDTDICYQYIPYATSGKVNLINLAGAAGSGVFMTQKQIDAYFDYHMDYYLCNYFKLDGKTIKEIKENQSDSSSNPEISIRFHYAGASSLPSSVVLYIEYNNDAWMNTLEEHTLEVLAGFRTPLFGEVKADKKFVYDPDARAWASVSAGSEFASENLVDTPSETKTEKKGCGSIAGASLAIVAIPALFAAAICLKKEDK